MRFALLLPAALLIAPSAAQDLEAWYKLDETAGPTCVDAAGNGHDGTFDGCTLALPSAHPELGTAVHFNGSGDKVDILDGPGFTDLRSELTIACWMNADTLGGVRRLFGNDGSWTWGTVGTGIRFTTRTIKDYDQPAGLVPNQWYHVCCVFDASFNVEFYLDGQLIGTIAGAQQANAPFPDWHIGYKDPGAPEWWFGLIDDIQVYDGVLDAIQVKWLFDHPGESLGAGPVGTSYCGPANANSTGAAALIEGFGKDSASANDLTLTAKGMPVGEVALFLCGDAQGFTPLPGGSQGNLCLSGSLGRFQSQLGTTDANGEFEIDVDLTALPVWPNHAVQPGESWYFQAWFTDGGTSNFTDALAVSFQ